MSRWNTISAILRLALFAVVIYLGFKVTVDFMQHRTAGQYYRDYYQYPKDRSDARNVDSRVAELRRSGNRDNLQVRIMLFDQLMFQAQFFPDRCEQPLKEVIEMGAELYVKHEPAREMVGDHLAVAYLQAGLPAKLESWGKEVAARTPYAQPRMQFLQVNALLLSDELAAARELIESELAERPGNKQTRAYAMAGYLVLDDVGAAQALDFEGLEDTDERSDIRRAYAALLLGSAEFEKAAKQYRLLIDKAPGDPDLAVYLAVALAATRGLADEEVKELLWTSTGSTRYPKSIDGAKAQVCVQLLDLTGDIKWRYALQELGSSGSKDFLVTALLGEALMLAPAAHVGQAAGGETGDESPAQAVGDALNPVSLGREALELASTEYERQAANLLLARAYVHDVYSTYESGDYLELALIHLRRALGDPLEADAVVSERLPEYDFFLLDDQVREIRQKFPRFDSAVNEAVVDFLNRRRERYKDVVEVEKIEYRGAVQ